MTVLTPNARLWPDWYGFECEEEEEDNEGWQQTVTPITAFPFVGNKNDHL